VASAPTATSDILERVRRTGLLAAGEPVVVLLSGGRDSVCLLDVAVVLCGTGMVSALHVNYGLRGDESDADERHCEQLAATLGVALTVERAQRPQGAAGNLHVWARDVRYGLGARLAGERGGVLAAAHTATDQAETILYRLASSPGRRALLGMAPRSNRLIRPLLGVTREQTEQWCRARGLQWRDDTSNADPRFARARVRANLVPALREVDERAEANVVRTAELLRDEAEVLDEVVKTALAGRAEIGLAHLGALPPALARLIVRRLAEDATGTLCPRAATRLHDLLALSANAQLDVGDGARAVVTGGVLRFVLSKSS
jgi:tRNA(Ile)-lysidine synthase